MCRFILFLTSLFSIVLLFFLLLLLSLSPLCVSSRPSVFFFLLVCFQLNRHDLFWQSHENTLNANNTSGTRLSFPDTAKHLVSHMLTVKPGHR